MDRALTRNQTSFDLQRICPIHAFWPSRARISLLCCAALVAFVVALHAGPAKADFRLCNKTGGRVGIALGYKDKRGWITEGWWNLPTKACETLLRGTLVARFYYIYAVDYDRGGEWSGHAFMCTKDKEFTIRGTEDCLARGFERTGFFEVDTGEQRSWTVQLTDAEQRPGRAAPQPPAEAGKAPAAKAPATTDTPASGPVSTPKSDPRKP